MSMPVFSLIRLLLWVFMSVIRYYLAGTKKDFVKQELSGYSFSSFVNNKILIPAICMRVYRYTGAVTEY